MSQPPNSPPPPYNYPGYPGHRPPAGYTYVPAPVMMPMPVYPGQHPGHMDPSAQHPTYITNIYPPSDTVHVTHPAIIVDTPPPIDWVQSSPYSAPSLGHKALVAGHEGHDGSPLWVIRSHHGGEFVPGKLAVHHKAADIPHDGKEVPVHNFEVLCAQPHSVNWIPSYGGQVPPGAYPAGNTQAGEPLYIARVRHANSLTPGKVHPSHGCAYISFGGVEMAFKHYEVLCEVR